MRPARRVTYVYRASDVQKPADERVHRTLWLSSGAAPTDGQQGEIVVESFVFTP